ncbi:hypothetical protein P154DRAFT_408665, partial [Amniculicola lignicola CBS 123094]
PRPLMATLTYTHNANMALGTAPGSPPDLTHSKSSKSSSFHSSTLSDIMGPNDLQHFEEINLDDLHGGLGPSSFHVPLSPASNRVLYEASRNTSSSTAARSLPPPHAHSHSFRDLTAGSKPRYPSLKGQVNQVVRQQGQLNAPSGRSVRRGFTSPSAPSLVSSLSVNGRRARSSSPSNPQTVPQKPRSLSRRSSRALDVSPSSSFPNPRRQSWQHNQRKSVKEREAECDDEDDELPEDAIIWNVPISPRPAQERSPAPSTCGSPPQTSQSPANSRPTSQRGEPSSSKNPPAIPPRQSSQPPSPNPATNESTTPPQLSRQRTWEDTYSHLDPDAKKLTEALEEFQSDFEKAQEVKRQQPGLSRSSSIERTPNPNPRAKTMSLPPLRKSDPLIDPFQPSMEKQKYLSRTRPSWLPPKDKKEEKKHLREYQRMLARIEEAERLEASRLEAEKIAREQAERVKAEYWENLLLPNWEKEMLDPVNRATHRKMWWNGIPPKLRGQVWLKAIGNDLETSETTYRVALEKALMQVEQLGDGAFEGRAGIIIENTREVFPELKMFAPAASADEEAQPLHQDLVNVCLAYTSYRPDVDTMSSIHHIAALSLLSLPPSSTFTLLTNLLNRPLPLSFLLSNSPAILATYSLTLRALANKLPQLAHRFESLRLEPHTYLAPMFTSVFADRLEVEYAARVMDLVAIEGDKILPRVAVGVLGCVEGGLYEGGGEAVVGRLGREGLRGRLGGVDEFVGRVYEAGKVG